MESNILYWDKVNSKAQEDIICAAFVAFLWTLCYIWKVLVPELTYICGVKNLESKKCAIYTIENNKMEDDKNDQSSCTIDIEELKTKIIDLENTEKDPPKYTELFPTV